MEHEELKDTLTVEQKINIQSIKDSENTLSQFSKDAVLTEVVIFQKTTKIS